MAPMDKNKTGGVSSAIQNDDMKAVASLAVLAKVHAEGLAVVSPDLLTAIHEHEASFNAWMATAPGDGDLPEGTPEDQAAFDAETRLIWAPCRSEKDIFAKVGYVYHRQSAAAQDAFDALVGRDDDLLGFLGSLINDDMRDDAPECVELVDPLLKVIDAYRGGVAAFNEVPLECITIENEASLVAATYLEAQTALENPPAATTLEGVREAIVFAFDEGGITDLVVRGALQGALAYFDAEVPDEKPSD